MGTLVAGITNALSGSDERFLQLEEKRIKLDEMMLKMEDRKKESDEREERRLRDEREFQLKLFTLLCSNTQAAPPPMMASPSIATAQVMEVVLLAVIICMTCEWSAGSVTVLLVIMHNYDLYNSNDFFYNHSVCYSYLLIKSSCEMLLVFRNYNTVLMCFVYPQLQMMCQ